MKSDYVCIIGGSDKRDSIQNPLKLRKRETQPYAQFRKAMGARRYYLVILGKSLDTDLLKEDWKSHTMSNSMMHFFFFLKCLRIFLMVIWPPHDIVLYVTEIQLPW